MKGKTVSEAPTACKAPPWQWLLDRIDREKKLLLWQFEESLRLSKKEEKK